MNNKNTYEYQKWGRFVAQVCEGLEKLAIVELKQCGARNIKPLYRALSFTADLNTLYQINYTSRIVTRVLAPLKTFDCHSDKYLYKTALKIEWSDFLTPDDTFAVFSSLSNSTIKHSHYCSLKVKDAIADYFVARFNKRPNVDTLSPTVWFNVHIAQNRACISIDTSNGSLHRRGYKKSSVEAPLQETLAAALIQLTGWNGTVPLHDPCCGSGTIVCEALMHACNIPAGYLRKRFGFASLPDFDLNEWETIRKVCNSKMRPEKSHLIFASDIDSNAVNATRMNVSQLPYGNNVNITHQPLEKASFDENEIIICNPPYGKRIGNPRNIDLLYTHLKTIATTRSKKHPLFVFTSWNNAKSIFRDTTLWTKKMINGADRVNFYCLARK